MAISLNGTILSILTVNGTNIETVNLDGVLVARKPTITTQPVGGTINDNQSHAISVAADGLGHGLTYQWFMDGAAISGATGASYTFNPAGDTTDRTFFCRVVGFGGGYTQTSTVTVTVNPSWAGNATITKAYRETSTSSWLWGFVTTGFVVGDLVPRVVNGTTYNDIRFQDSSSGKTYSVSIAGSHPTSSRVRLSINAAQEWTFAFRQDYGTSTIYDTDNSIESWFTTLETVPIILSYAASLEAADAEDFYDESKETIDEYHIRWGVHKTQRSDLYDN